MIHLPYMPNKPVSKTPLHHCIKIQQHNRPLSESGSTKNSNDHPMSSQIIEKRVTKERRRRNISVKNDRRKRDRRQTKTSITGRLPAREKPFTVVKRKSARFQLNRVIRDKEDYRSGAWINIRI